MRGTVRQTSSDSLSDVWIIWDELHMDMLVGDWFDNCAASSSGYDSFWEYLTWPGYYLSSRKSCFSIFCHWLSYKVSMTATKFYNTFPNVFLYFFVIVSVTLLRLFLTCVLYNTRCLRCLGVIRGQPRRAPRVQQGVWSNRGKVQNQALHLLFLQG